VPLTQVVLEKTPLNGFLKQFYGKRLSIKFPLSFTAIKLTVFALKLFGSCLCSHFSYSVLLSLSEIMVVMFVLLSIFLVQSIDKGHMNVVIVFFVKWSWLLS